VTGALPIDQSSDEENIKVGQVDIAPTDPIEEILIAQLMAANEAALAERPTQCGPLQPDSHRLRGNSFWLAIAIDSALIHLIHTGFSMGVRIPRCLPQTRRFDNLTDCAALGFPCQKSRASATVRPQSVR
jgi:hypothetical protein